MIGKNTTTLQQDLTTIIEGICCSQDLPSALRISISFSSFLKPFFLTSKKSAHLAWDSRLAWALLVYEVHPIHMTKLYFFSFSSSSFNSRGICVCFVIYGINVTTVLFVLNLLLLVFYSSHILRCSSVMGSAICWSNVTPSDDSVSSRSMLSSNLPRSEKLADISWLSKSDMTAVPEAVGLSKLIASALCRACSEFSSASVKENIYLIAEILWTTLTCLFAASLMESIYLIAEILRPSLTSCRFAASLQIFENCVYCYIHKNPVLKHVLCVYCTYYTLYLYMYYIIYDVLIHQ